MENRNLKPGTHLAAKDTSAGEPTSGRPNYGKLDNSIWLLDAKLRECQEAHDMHIRDKQYEAARINREEIDGLQTAMTILCAVSQVVK